MIRITKEYINEATEKCYVKVDEIETVLKVKFRTCEEFGISPPIVHINSYNDELFEVEFINWCDVLNVEEVEE